MMDRTDPLLMYVSKCLNLAKRLAWLRDMYILESPGVAHVNGAFSFLANANALRDSLSACFTVC